MESKIDRRNFFGKIGKASLVAAVVSVIPFKIFGKGKIGRALNVKVKIHPSAVKRNNKV
jgi:hypothetical protein